jgi:hypothetical protein
MPISAPRKGETKDKFINRCMGDDVMNREYPGAVQRRAVCESAWDKKHALLIEWAQRRGLTPCQVDKLVEQGIFDPNRIPKD